jgi:dTDP-4-dehydrorhamnose reductase
MILVFGKTGQVATELRALGGVNALGREAADLSDPDSCAAAIRGRRPAAVINAAAYTAVDKAEEVETAAAVINAEAPGAMARACAEADIPFVHISTDYVFDGTGTDPFAPEHPVAPLNAYGRTKLAGEEAVVKAGGRYAVLRTSWVFSAYGSNFLKTMLRLGRERDALSIVDDQIGGPTPARAIAEASLAIADQLRRDPGKSGTYHLSGAPDTSWAGFARAIFDEAGLACTVTGIPTSAYPTPAARPKNSRLNCDTLETFALSRPDWRREMRQIIAELES